MSEPQIWALVDDRPGNVAQVLGVAEALGWPFETREIRYGPLARLPNPLQGALPLGLDARTRRALAEAPPPDVAIAAGRRAAPVLRWLRRRSRGRCLTVQLMWPGSARGLDLIAVPAHDDPPRGAGILVTQGAPHRITPERLAREAERWAAAVAHLPRPRIACLVGGSSRHAAFTQEDAARLGREASALARAEGGSLMVTTSRRTGEACAAALQATIDAPAFVHLWGSPGDNPYVGLIGLGDRLVVTADSASMCSEALARGRPVHLFVPAAGTAAKLARFHASLRAAGLLHGLDERAARVPPPQNPAIGIAAAIRARLGPAAGGVG